MYKGYGARTWLYITKMNFVKDRLLDQSRDSYMYIASYQHTIWIKLLEGEMFGETVHIKNWWIIFWWMPKIAKAPNNNYTSSFTGEMKS